MDFLDPEKIGCLLPKLSTDPQGGKYVIFLGIVIKGLHNMALQKRVGSSDDSEYLTH